MKRWRKSLHVGLVVRYTIFFIVSILAVLIMLMAFLGYFLESMTSDAIDASSNPMRFSGYLTEETLILENPPFGTEWIDYLKDGEVIKSDGERQLDTSFFSTDTLNQMLLSVFYAPRHYGYNAKVMLYPYDEATTEIAIIFTTVYQDLSIGISVPDEFKGTAVEAELQSKLNGVFLLILLALGVVILFFSIITYRMIIKPIKSLNAGLMAVKHGELSTRISYKGYSELMMLTDAFNSMAERLELAESEAFIASESKKSMILNLSHDLRTPATVVQGYAQALHDGKVSEDKKERYYTYLLEKSSVIVSRIEQLFAYAKLDVRHYDLNFQHVELCEFIRLMVIGYLEDISLHKQSLEIDLPSAPIWCALDPTEMSRAIGNLIENAIKYSGEGSEITIRVEKHDDPQGFAVIVQDNGQGLGKDMDAERLFNPFVRGDLARHTDGTGLGLAIAKQIARLHGGDLECTPLEKGLRFTFWGRLKV